MPIFITSTGAI